MAEQWQNPHKPIKAGEATAKPPRDYIGPAMDAVKTLGMSKPHVGHESIVAAIILAQALDRFGEKLIDAAAVSQYKRGP